MAYFLRALIVLAALFLLATLAQALGWISLALGHIELAMPTYLVILFTQAFVMFYLIGVARLTQNVNEALAQESNLHEVFESPPADLAPYKKKLTQWAYEAHLAKRQVIPWCILIVVLGMVAVLLGAAHDTHLVSRPVHSGVSYGFGGAMVGGGARQWFFLGRAHILLRKLKGLFSIPDASM